MGDFFEFATQGLVLYASQRADSNDQRAAQAQAQQARQFDLQQQTLTARSRNIALAIGAFTVGALGFVIVTNRRAAA